MKTFGFIKRLLAIIAVFVLILCSESCKTSKVTDGTYGISPVSVVSFKPDTLTVQQMDSVSRHDNLPKYSDWRKSTFKDAETNETVTYYTLVDQESNTIYTLKTLKNNTFVLFKKQYKETF